MNSIVKIRRKPGIWAVVAILLMGFQHQAAAQFGGPPPPPPSPGRDVAPIDLTGQWVSVVSEDWRFRMVVPPKNDYPGLPLTQAARAAAAAWDPERDAAEGEACKAYGVGNIMRMPTRLRIDWRDESTLEIQTDAGRQTRLLHFDGTAEPLAEPTWQGLSEAQWEFHGGGFRRPSVGGNLKVVTTGMRAGYVRFNGVPYSEDAVVTEYFDVLEQLDGSEWLTVLTIVEDPVNLFTPMITSSNFRRQTDRRGWAPQDCRVD